MNLTEHYNQLYKTSSEIISAGKYAIDSELKNESDSRFGITLLIRPNDEIIANIQTFINELKKAEPEQYFYPDSDIHITVMSIISCSENFTLNQISPNEYIEVICRSLVEVDKIKIHYQGITVSPSAIMIQGFPSDETLNNLRNRLRENFKKSGLQQSIDSRYEISTAHSTVMRFQEKLQNPKKLIEIAEKFRDYDFGTFEVKNLELVYNDWYQRKNTTRVLGDFGLR
ncbi:AKAP7 2'5' RNA ligase-like domain-containing protein [Flavobacterium sp. TR2]|uniref:2'-5' RNA ligase family protein n=1 Tax=Flavobacterium sp. TR2 TaxID=2977321 RepID=UPI0021B0F456|nr:AKAP7 2'5' RNA ligase-like domain-containing protein [Flavobacterium sp. TR2]UWY27951.1 AKAP7 2'5' RNA ligase-like domain-containing protein [Flavobacterium sp. TR2]